MENAFEVLYSWNLQYILTLTAQVQKEEEIQNDMADISKHAKSGKTGSATALELWSLLIDLIWNRFEKIYTYIFYL